MYSDAPIAQRLRWLGHIARMEADNVSRKIFDNISQGGQRGRGMRRLQWQESVLADVKAKIAKSKQQNSSSNTLERGNAK